MHRRLAAIQVADESGQAAFVLKHLGFFVALVDEFDAHAGIEKGQLAQALRERFVVERDVREDLRARLEAQRSAALLRITDRGERRLRLAQAIFLAVQFAVAADIQLQIIRQRIDHRDADPVQAARDLVGAVVELSAGVQHGHDDLGGGDALLAVNVDRNAAAVVDDRYRFVRMDGDHDAVAVAGQAPRQWRCPPPRTPCDAGRCRHRYRRCTFRAVCERRRDLLRL